MTARDVVIELRKINQCATLQVIGDAVGVTRERVRQILSDAGLPTAHWKQRYLCIVCGGEIKDRRRRYRHSPFCSNECSHKYYYLTLICDMCGKPFERQVSHILMYPSRMNKKNPALNMRQSITVCSKQCHGRWLSKHRWEKEANHA